MIGKVKACKGSGILSTYVMKDGKGYELDRNGLSGTTPEEITQEMKIIQDQNTRAENKTFSMVLSPTIKDGENLSNKELREITREFMAKLGIDPKEQQYIAYIHTEKKHKHIHVIANRVQDNGKLLPDHFIGKKAQTAAHEIAVDRGLTSAKEVKNKNELKLDQVLLNEMYSKHQKVMQRHPQSMELYREAMKREGIEVIPTINKQGKLQGHRYKDLATGKCFKASQVHRNLSLQNLLKQGLPLEKSVELPKHLLSLQFKAIKMAYKLTKKLLNISQSGGIGY